MGVPTVPHHGLFSLLKTVSDGAVSIIHDMSCDMCGQECCKPHGSSVRSWVVLVAPNTSAKGWNSVCRKTASGS